MKRKEVTQRKPEQHADADVDLKAADQAPPQVRWGYLSKVHGSSYRDEAGGYTTHKTRDCELPKAESECSPKRCKSV
jgi:hypothetical protein